jgi:hypothetical protein
MFDQLNELLQTIKNQTKQKKQTLPHFPLGKKNAQNSKVHG